MRKSAFVAVATSAMLFASIRAGAAVVFSDDYSEAPGTLIANKPADVGGPYTVTVPGTAPGPIAVSAANRVDTSGSRRVFSAPFAGGETLGPGEVLTFSVNVATPTLRTGTSFAGFYLLAGTTRSGFFGDVANDNSYTIAQNETGTGAFDTGNTIEPADLVFRYAYDTGAVSLSVNGATLASGNLTAMRAVTGFEVENNGGGDINFDNVVIDVVPEPSTLGVLGIGAAALLARRRARP